MDEYKMINILVEWKISCRILNGKPSENVFDLACDHTEPIFKEVNLKVK